MKLKITKEWLEKNIHLEDGVSVTAMSPEIYAEMQMQFIEKNLPQRQLAHFKARIKKDPSLLSKVYNFARKTSKWR